MAVAGFMFEAVLGSVYAWSVVADRLQSVLGWSPSQASLPFVVLFATASLGTVLGGRLAARFPPRGIAVMGGVAYAVGLLMSALADAPGQLWLLVLTYGVVAGVGNGVAYITVFPTLAGWFDERRGLGTGIAAAGYGAGTLAAAPFLAWLLSRFPDDPTEAFLYLGVATLVLVIATGPALRPAPAEGDPRPRPEGDGNNLLTDRHWWVLVAVLGLNLMVGVGMSGQLAPIVRDVTGVGFGSAAILVGGIALFQAAGGLVLGYVSDRIGRRLALVAALLAQSLALLVLPAVTSPVAFGALAAVVTLVYGGGFGTMPAAAADVFGRDRLAGSYAPMLAVAGVLAAGGPYIVGWLAEISGDFQLPLLVLSGVSAGAAALSWGAWPREASQP